MKKPTRTSYPVNFRINFKSDQMERIEEAAGILGQPKADVIRDGADKWARRVIADHKKPQKSV
ncbi:MAG TPA: hypothetical protein VK558_13670 [Patescibacteria group bacterium]|nr:hypothetical protein [Patescibacteria group bacterium]